MRSTFSTLFYVKRNQPKKNGHVIIMIRVTVDGNYVQFSSKLDVPPLLWDNKDGRAMGKSAESQRINRSLDALRSKIAQHYNHLTEIDGYATPEKIKNLLLGIIGKNG